MILGYIMYLAITLCTGELVENFLFLYLLYFPSQEEKLMRHAFLRPYLLGHHSPYRAMADSPHPEDVDGLIHSSTTTATGEGSRNRYSSSSGKRLGLHVIAEDGGDQVDFYNPGNSEDNSDILNMNTNPSPGAKRRSSVITLDPSFMSPEMGEQIGLVTAGTNLDRRRSRGESSATPVFAATFDTSLTGVPAPVNDSAPTVAGDPDDDYLQV